MDEEIINLLGMKTHDVIGINGQMFACLRVFGGWIYFDKSNSIGVFVPEGSNYNNK